MSKSEPIPPNNEIWYTTTDCNSINLPSSGWGSGVTLLSQSKVGDVWKAVFTGDVTIITGGSNQAFNGRNNLLSVILPNSAATLANWAFTDCTNVESIRLSSSVSSIGTESFRNCKKLKNVNIPDTLEIFEAGIFYDCDEINLCHLPNSLREIKNQSFLSSNASFTEIPNSVTFFGSNLFAYLVSIPYLNIRSVIPPTCQTNTFSSCNFPIYVPAEALEAYKSASGWSNFADRIFAIPE